MSNNDFYELCFPPDYWEKIDRSSLIEDPHSMFGDSETFDWLIRATKPDSIIEVGSWKGHSANFMADICRSIDKIPKILCIDTFLGAVEHWCLPGEIKNLHLKNGRPTILERFQANTIARKNQDIIFPFPIDSDNAAQVLSHYDFKADLIFIDAAHDYDDVTKDIVNYWKLLAENGVFFGDDYQYEPLRRAVHDCATQLGVQVIVSQRKWMFFNQGLANCVFPHGYSLRLSPENWVHP